MDIAALGEEASLEAARELLIAISYSKPDKFLNPVAAKKFKSGAGGLVVDADGADAFRSKLISISDLQSAEISLMKCKGNT